MSTNENETKVVEKSETKKDEFTTYFTDGKVNIPEFEKVLSNYVV